MKGVRFELVSRLFATSILRTFTTGSGFYPEKKLDITPSSSRFSLGITEEPLVKTTPPPEAAAVCFHATEFRCNFFFTETKRGRDDQRKETTAASSTQKQPSGPNPTASRTTISLTVCIHAREQHKNVLIWSELAHFTTQLHSPRSRQQKKTPLLVAKGKYKTNNNTLHFDHRSSMRRKD